MFRPVPFHSVLGFSNHRISYHCNLYILKCFGWMFRKWKHFFTLNIMRQAFCKRKSANYNRGQCFGSIVGHCWAFTSFVPCFCLNSGPKNRSPTFSVLFEPGIPQSGEPCPRVLAIQHGQLPAQEGDEPPQRSQGYHRNWRSESVL